MSSESTSRQSTQTLRVGIILARDFTLSALATFVDTLRLASDIDDRSRQLNCGWDILSATGRPHRSSAGLSLSPTAELRNPRSYDYVAVVGGLLHHERPLDEASIGFLRQAAAAGVPLIGLCTGTFILAAAGLLSGRRACVSWFHLEEFRERFPDISASADRLFIEAGDRITCSGGVGSADLAAHLIERHLGVRLKTKALEVLQVERARSGADPQARKPGGADATLDPRVRRALLIMEQNVEQPVSMAGVAVRVGLSSRSLERLFLRSMGLAPHQAYVRLRLEAARHLVAGSDRPIIDIAIATGFSQHSHFTRRFRAAFGFTPSELRRGGCNPQ